MASFNYNLQMWSASTGGYFHSKEEAEAAEQQGAGASNAYGDEEFAQSTGGLATGDTQQNYLRTERTAAETDALQAARAADLEKERLASIPYGTAINEGGTAELVSVQQPGVGTINTTRGGIRNAPAQVVARSTGYGGMSLTGPTAGSAVDANATRADARTTQAETDFRNTDDANALQNENLWNESANMFRNLDGANYGLSDEARTYQREGLQQQRELLERLLGFDPNQYATQFADQALARSVALGRSAGGGAAAQQAGMFAAQEQLPGLQAEGARMAAGLENQRLQAAQQVSKAFGDLGTMTRGQDETRAQFDAQLPLEIAEKFSAATQGKMALNEQESQRFADIWMNFAQLQSVYDKMSLEEQLAWWDREMQEKGLTQQYEMFKQELAAQKEAGEISGKDIIGGLFQLGGGIITGGASILAAGA